MYSLRVSYCIASYMNGHTTWWCLKVDSEYAAGRVSEAIRASMMARRLNFMGIFLGFALVVAAVIVIVAIAVADANDDDDDYYYYYNNNNNY